MSGFKAPNYTQTPNDVFDELLPDLGYAELKVLLVVIRHTFGYHKDRWRLSVTKMQKRTGLSRQAVQDGATKLEARGLIERLQDGGVTIWRAIVEDPTVQATGIAILADSTPILEASIPILEASTPSNKENLQRKPTKKKDSDASASPSDTVTVGKPRKRNPYFDNVAQICGYGTDADIKQHSSMIAKAANYIKGRDDDAAAILGFGKWWKREDFRGKKGTLPKPRWVIDEWASFSKTPGFHQTREIDPELAAQLAAHKEKLA